MSSILDTDYITPESTIATLQKVVSPVKEREEKQCAEEREERRLALRNKGSFGYEMAQSLQRSKRQNQKPTNLKSKSKNKKSVTINLQVKNGDVIVLDALANFFNTTRSLLLESMISADVTSMFKALPEEAPGYVNYVETGLEQEKIASKVDAEITKQGLEHDLDGRTWYWVMTDDRERAFKPVAKNSRNVTSADCYAYSAVEKIVNEYFNSSEKVSSSLSLRLHPKEGLMLKTLSEVLNLPVRSTFTSFISQHLYDVLTGLDSDILDQLLEAHPEIRRAGGDGPCAVEELIADKVINEEDFSLMINEI